MRCVLLLILKYAIVPLMERLWGKVLKKNLYESMEKEIVTNRYRKRQQQLRLKFGLIATFWLIVWLRWMRLSPRQDTHTPLQLKH